MLPRSLYFFVGSDEENACGRFLLTGVTGVTGILCCDLAGVILTLASFSQQGTVGRVLITFKILLDVSYLCELSEI